MKNVKWVVLILVVGFAFSSLTSSVSQAQTAPSSEAIRKTLSTPSALSQLDTSFPKVEKPDWYFDTTIYFTISKNGSVSDLGTFTTLVTETLNDSRGWARLGAKFVQVNSGGTLHIVLAQGSLLPSYSSGCSVDWSCAIGNTVIINDTRWSNASDAWNAAGGSLRDYRHMVVNHETGHWLGHDHESCRAPGGPAPLMQQQSIDLMGCTFNPWPLESELWTSRF